MKQKIMDREKFDQILKDKVQKFEQEYSPVFNQHLVWKGTKKGKSKMNLFLLAAASAIIILGLSMLFQQYHRPAEMAKLKKSPLRSGKAFQIPDTQPRTLGMAINKPEKQKGKFPNLNSQKPESPIDVNQSILAIPVSGNSIQKADSSQARSVQIIEPVKIKTTELPMAINDAVPEIKVTFKRGNLIKEGLPPESKLAFKKFKLRIFENQTYDTSAYASGAEMEAEKKFRIKF